MSVNQRSILRVGLLRWAVISSSLLIVGCERQNGGTSTAAGPSTAPTTSTVAQNATARAPSTAPATTQAAPTFIWIDKQPYQFPPARLILKDKDDQLVALLFSDDPPNAIDENYQGNSFYFEITPDLAEQGTIAGASWDYKAPNSERVDTISGIFLQGRKKHLEPFDVHVEFAGAASPLKVSIRGTFLMFTENDLSPGQLVSVRAELPAELKVKASK